MDVLRTLAASGPVGWDVALVAVLLAFGLGQAIALTYVRTHRGLSYSRSFVQGIALGAIVTCMLLLAIGDSIAAGIGLAGGLSIIRFRTTMRDPRDMIFIFAGLGVGIVCGLRAWPAAIVGTAVFCAAVVALDVVGFGNTRRHDAILRFVAGQAQATALREVLATHAPQAALVTLREASQGDEVEHAYQLSLPAPEARLTLVDALRAVEGVHTVRLHALETTEEL